MKFRTSLFSFVLAVCLSLFATSLTFASELNNCELCSPPPPPTPPTPTGGEGCTPGYWRQEHHFDSWVNYAPTDSFDAVFGVDAPGNETLASMVQIGGGGSAALGRHAVAALLNANQNGVSYLYTPAQVISMVQAAFASGDFETTKDLFALQNEMGCPLN
jgi:hypothetical protein